MGRAGGESNRSHRLDKVTVEGKIAATVWPFISHLPNVLVGPNLEVVGDAITQVCYRAHRTSCCPPGTVSITSWMSESCYWRERARRTAPMRCDPTPLGSSVGFGESFKVVDQNVTAIGTVARRQQFRFLVSSTALELSFKPRFVRPPPTSGVLCRSPLVSGCRADLR